MNSKQKKIAGYLFTGLLTAFLIPSGFFQLTANEQVVTVFHRLQIDNILMIRFLGAMKLLAAVGLWVPRARNWAFHGLTFLFCGALFTHFGAGDVAKEFFGPALGLGLVAASEWFARNSGGGKKAKATVTKIVRRRRAA